MKARNLLYVLLPASLTMGCVSAVRGDAKDGYDKKTHLVDGKYRVRSEIEDQPAIYEITDQGSVCKIWYEDSDIGQRFIQDLRCDNTVDSIHNLLKSKDGHSGSIIFPREFLQTAGVADDYDALLKKVRESVKAEDRVDGDIGDLLKPKNK